MSAPIFVKEVIDVNAKKRKIEEKRERITALYPRVSTEAQSEEGYSLDAQIEKMIHWCKMRDISTYVVYQDGGFSGSNLNRPGMQKLIQDIEAGLIERVIVYKLDRLSRSQKDTLYLFEDVFIPNDVEFVSLNENLDTGSPYGMAMIGIMSAFAQLERQNIRDRTRMGMRERVRDGYWMGGATIPFGYDYDSNQDILVPNAHAHEVQEIYDLYLRGFSTTKLAQMYPVCSDRQITQILDRVTYLGKIKYNGELFDGRHKALISQETWDLVQAERKKRSTKKTTTSKYLLTGLMVCGKCGAKMRYQKGRKDSLFIMCYSQDSKKHLCRDPNCDNKRCHAKMLEDIVLEDLFSATDLITVSRDEIQAKPATKNNSVISKLKDKSDDISMKIKRLYNLYAENGDETLKQIIEDQRKELDALSVMIDREKQNIKDENEESRTIGMVENLRSRWPFLSMQERHRVLRLCISRITITDDAVDISYAL